MKRAAIYLRISADKSGLGLGVERQGADCQELAKTQDWQVVQVFTDNDISAFSGRRRPGYEAMLDAIKSGQIDVVIAWSHDRLHRRPKELETYIDVCGSVNTYTVKAGHFDLSTPSGRAIARTLAAWASYETETSTARVLAAKLQAARSGKWDGGQRPFGYEPGCSAIRESEAEIYREMVQRVIDGESFRSVALDLNQREITTTNGKGWNALKVRNLLTHKRYAGIREHHNAEYPAVWDALINRETLDQLQLAITMHARLYKQRGPVRKHLLIGFAYCGRCGNRMNTAPRRKDQTRYVCRRFDDEHGEIGCGRIQRISAPVDHLIAEAVLYRLESAEFTHELSNVHNDTAEVTELMRQHRVQAERVQEIKQEYAQGDMTRDDRDLYLASATDKLGQIDRAVESATVHTTFSTLPVGVTARAAWESSDLAWKREVLSLLIKRVVINPSDVHGIKNTELYAGQWRFRPEDVTVEWLI